MPQRSVKRNSVNREVIDFVIVRLNVVERVERSMNGAWYNRYLAVRINTPYASYFSGSPLLYNF